jgi:hypothetical protein
MKRDWIKMDVGILNDPKYGTLTIDDWRLMIQLNLLAGESDRDGLLPHVRDIAWMLHTGPGDLQLALHRLCERGLVHSTPQGWVVTGFKESQAAPTSTERTRAFRKRQRSAKQDEAESNQEAAQKRTYGATEMQPARHIPVSKPVAKPVPDPAQPGRPGKSRRRRKAKGQPVEKTEDTCPVDKPVGKGRKNSDPTPGTTSSNSSLIKYLSTSSLIKYLKPTSTSSRLIKFLSTSLNLILLLLVDQADLKIKPEKFRPSQEKTLKNKLNAPGRAPFAATPQFAPGGSGQAAENLREPVAPVLWIPILWIPILWITMWINLLKRGGNFPPPMIYRHETSTGSVFV